MLYWKNLMRAIVPAKLRASTIGYEAASTGRRMVNWKATDEGINALIFNAGGELRRRSRDMIRKNSWAANAVDSFVSNAIGSGITPRSKHPKKAVREKIQKLWLRWTDEADASGLTDFYGLQSMACRATVEAGECLVRIRNRRPEDGLSVPLQLQLLEAEHLPSYKTETVSEGRTIRAGIEFDAIGRRVAYHLYREHPGDASIFANAMDITRVPADQVVHIYRPLRPGQLRGQPWLTPVLVKLYDLDKFDDAVLMLQQVAAQFAGFITKTNPEDSPLPGTSTINDGNTTAAAKTDFVGMEPGTMQELLPGENITFSTPPNMGSAYVEFMRTQLRAIAAGLGITYEQLTGDLTGVNYSSIRAGLLEFRRRCEQFQHQVIVFQFCRPIWRRWIVSAVLAGELPIADFQRQPENYLAVEWRTPKWAWVDPLKDARAEVEQVLAGFKSRAAVVAEQGYDVEDVDAEQATDNARADSLGLKPASDNRHASTGAAPAPKEPMMSATEEEEKQKEMIQ